MSKVTVSHPLTATIVQRHLRSRLRVHIHPDDRLTGNREPVTTYLEPQPGIAERYYVCIGKPKARHYLVSCEVTLVDEEPVRFEFRTEAIGKQNESRKP